MIWLKRLMWATLLVGICGGGYLALYHPDTPLPREWHPLEPLRVTDPVTPLTDWKLRTALTDPDLCVATLAQTSQFTRLPDLEQSDQCHIRNRVRVTNLSGLTIRPTETRCDTALTTAMWLEHGVKPAAQEVFNQSVTAVRTQGSYNCRTIAGSTRMSQHATARALDVAGFTLGDGSQINLLQDWSGDPLRAGFLARVRDTSCDWFKTTLGPDFNRAHADHFHLQVEGWGTCR